MLDILLNKQIFVHNAFYGLISPTVTNVEFLSKDENYCKFKITATLENIEEYSLEIKKMNNLKDDIKAKLFSNFIEHQDDYDCILTLKNKYFFLSNKYSFLFRKYKIGNLTFETEIEIYRAASKIEFLHNRKNEYNDAYLLHIFVPGLNDNGFFGDKVIRSQFSYHYCPYNTGDARLLTSKELSMDNIIEDYFLNLLKEKDSIFLHASICNIEYDDKIEKQNINCYISEYLEELENCLKLRSSLFNNYEYLYFENSLSKLNRIKTNFIAKEIFDLIASSELFLDY